MGLVSVAQTHSIPRTKKGVYSCSSWEIFSFQERRAIKKISCKKIWIRSIILSLNSSLFLSYKDLKIFFLRKIFILIFNRKIMNFSLKESHVHVSGTLWGVGVGPGDVELLTLKAVNILRAAPVVAYPAPLKGMGLARQIADFVLRHNPYCIEIAIRMRFNADRISAQAAYDRGAAAIATHLAAGQDVAVLCEGDPLFFGSFAYILERLGEHFLVKIVPGVTSVTACSAVLQQPFALRDDRAAIIPAQRPEAEIEEILLQVENAAIIKVGRHFPKVVAVLDRLDLRKRAWHIERAFQQQQRIRSLSTMVGVVENPTYFSTILVHRREKI